MNSLSYPEQLQSGQTLVSNNGYFTLELFPDGTLALYRTQVKHTMWTSPPSQPGGFAAMQDDGNFVTYSPAGVAAWASNTDGHPGAWLALLDDGNLVVRDSHRLLWQTHTETDLQAPTIRYVKEGGYSYNETAENWKAMCQAFPCFVAMQWPGYASVAVEDVIDGQPVVIQLWKGLCSKFGGFLGLQNFPGGVGAEVGIYRRIPGKASPTTFPGLPQFGVAEKLINELSAGEDADIWWPFPELDATIEFNFINPLTGEIVFSAGPQKSYWLTKWMDENVYPNYQSDHSAPAAYTDYILDFTVNGKTYPTWPAAPGGGGPAAEPGHPGELAQAAWTLLLAGENPELPPLPPVGGGAQAPWSLLLAGEYPPPLRPHPPATRAPQLGTREHMYDGECQIRRAGISPEGFAQLDLKAEGGEFDWTWFLSKAEISREVLATALVAVNCDKRLAIQIEDPVAAWGRVIRCLVVK